METVTDVRPGVTVQEFAEGLMEEPEILRMKAGPAELQVPGRLSRSAYKVSAVYIIRHKAPRR